MLLLIKQHEMMKLANAVIITCTTLLPSMSFEAVPLSVLPY